MLLTAPRSCIVCECAFLFPFDFIYIYVYIFNLKYKEESGICGEVLLFTRFIEY